MNKHEIKLLLQGSRPGEPGLEPDLLLAALAALAQDEELQAWYERDQAFDQAFLEKLQQIDPPGNLRDSILAKNSARGISGPPTRFPFSQQTWSLAAAAMAIFFLGFSLPWFFKQSAPVAEATETGAVPAYIAHLSDAVLNRPKALEQRGASLDQMRTHLASARVSSHSFSSREFERMEAIGCLVLEWEAIQIGMVCFREENAVFHLLYADIGCYADLFPGLPKNELPVFFRLNDTAFRVWADDFHINILTHEGPYQELNRFF